MLLTITLETQEYDASDLGYLLEKHPEKLQSFSLAYGQAHVFYPEISQDRCTAALLLDFDSIGLIRNHKREQNQNILSHYVNDRRYTASSFLSVAIAQVFSSAMKNQSRERQSMADAAHNFTINLSTIACHGGEKLLHELFEPLEYKVVPKHLILDDQFPQWGESSYYQLELQANLQLSQILTHIYILIPVLDNAKHYWVEDAEIEKLLQKAGDWLKDHPKKELITKRYLKYKKRLYSNALTRLIADETTSNEVETVNELQEDVLEYKLSLNDARIQTIISVIEKLSPQRIVDLGCGEGKLLRELLKIKKIDHILGVDVSISSLERAKEKLKIDNLSEKNKERIELRQSSLLYRDEKLKNFDVACAIEVIEHIDLCKLNLFEEVLFSYAKPAVVIITTPNSEYNIKFSGLSSGQYRHQDHRFEWSRTEFQTWALDVAQRYNYSVEFQPIGEIDQQYGSPTQMGVFKL